MSIKNILLLAVIFCGLPLSTSKANDLDVHQLIEAAIEYYRGQASIATVEMTIVRPHWERKMTMKAWTKGQKNSLFAIVAPSKDRGNGTLKRGREMWTYNPKINRVIKLPPSMMSQAWMGSDFSNNDLAKSDSILEDYTHKLIGMEMHEGKKVYVIESIPKPDAPVIWGMQRLKIREDKILLSEGFYDEDGTLVKIMTGSRIKMMGGKLFPQVWQMQKSDTKDEYTRLNYHQLEFKEDLPDNIFTQSYLRSSHR
jgi:outer membrane lipoprotein-sorting protein